MKNYRYLLYYILTIGGFTMLMYMVVLKGELLNPLSDRSIPVLSQVTSLDHFRESVNQNLNKALPRLLLQIITIIAVARIFGFLSKKIGQPAVIGEIIAGIFLGPSILGFVAPGISGFLFPTESIQILEFFSQIGLILFMFIIGMDIDLKVLGKKAPEAFVVSHASIVIPFALGMGLAYFIYTSSAPAGVPFLSFALFTGISMSITAFPVLARILQERNIVKTQVGTLALTCAAIDDISAWCLLAALIAIVKAGSFVSSLYTILLSVIYVIVMLKIVRPFLYRLGEIFTRKDGISKPVVAIFLVTLLLSSYITEIIGIHAIFGAFVAGIIMPPNVSFRKILIEKLEDLALILLLPIFFVISGLRTEIGLINTPYMWKITGWVIIIAVAGKFAGSALSLRFVGQKWRDSLIIGALMNTRGLMQLVVLSIGYELGVISPQIYTIMIIMALVTTLMAGPALDLIERFLPEKKETPAEKNIPDLFRILISFGNPENGKTMLRLAYNFVRSKKDMAAITLLHLTPVYDMHKYVADEYERESFRPVIREAEKLGIKINCIFRATEDIEREIIETANSGDYDLIIAGKGHSLYEGTLLGNMIRIITRVTNPGRVIGFIRGKEKLFSKSVFDGPTRRLVKAIKIQKAIFADNDFKKCEIVVIPVYSSEDTVLFSLAGKLSTNCGAMISILDYYNQIEYNDEMKQSLKKLSDANPGRIETYVSDEISGLLAKGPDLLLVTPEGWHKIVHDKRIPNLPPSLIIRP
jgi:Kef-type K+ transport system membrane component KefB/nucleotide-binding universal stress UspA family protein